MATVFVGSSICLWRRLCIGQAFLTRAQLRAPLMDDRRALSARLIATQYLAAAIREVWSDPVVLIPLDPEDTRAIHWMAESGGVGGKAYGIHSNWLRPYQRVLAELAKLLAMVR